MKRIIIAICLAAAGSAFADDITIEATPFVSTRTRAEVIAEMQAVNTGGVEPMSHALDVVQRLRADDATETDQHALFQSVAQQVEGGLYLVPKVIE